MMTAQFALRIVEAIPDLPLKMGDPTLAMLIKDDCCRLAAERSVIRRKRYKEWVIVLRRQTHSSSTPKVTKDSDRECPAHRQTVSVGPCHRVLLKTCRIALSWMLEQNALSDTCSGLHAVDCLSDQIALVESCRPLSAQILSIHPAARALSDFFCKNCKGQKLRPSSSLAEL
jgi:hypothetical protein